MTRTAQCSCGQLSVKVEGEPDLVVLCNCECCQRRTGSAFGIGAYFSHDRVKEIAGEQTKYQRSTDSARWAESSFCPVCGTTVYWQLEMWPEKYGLAVGCFTDPHFPQPLVSAWSVTKHDWVQLPEGCHELEAQR